MFEPHVRGLNGVVLVGSSVIVPSFAELGMVGATVVGGGGTAALVIETLSRLKVSVVEPWDPPRPIRPMIRGLPRSAAENPKYVHVLAGALMGMIVEIWLNTSSLPVKSCRLAPVVPPCTHNETTVAGPTRTGSPVRNDTAPQAESIFAENAALPLCVGLVEAGLVVAFHE